MTAKDYFGSVPLPAQSLRTQLLGAEPAHPASRSGSMVCGSFWVAVTAIYRSVIVVIFRRGGKSVLPEYRERSINGETARPAVRRSRLSSAASDNYFAVQLHASCNYSL